MKKIYVIFAFHAHELLWDLPEILLSYLSDDNPMKNTFLDENYIKKRKEQGRDIYSQCSEFGDRLKAPMCVEYSNELLTQISEVIPDTFDKLKRDYQRGRLYPIFGHAHHTHVSLLQQEEIIQEIMWNRQYLHNYMGVPTPRYNGLFSTEASYSNDKMDAIKEANIDYVIFPHLNKEKVPFEIQGKGDYRYGPFLVQTSGHKLLALPRNFPISQEIWRPITKMKREEVKNQGYMLGDFAVFDTEYITGKQEEYPITLEQGVGIYKKVLLQELENCPDEGVLLYIQDLELMDYGDIALEIMEKAWIDVLDQTYDKYSVDFVTPDYYIDKVIKPRGTEGLPVLSFDKINWSPEIRLILRVDGHYPPLGVNNVGGYSIEKTGTFDKPHIFWENGKYYCGIFDTLLNIFGFSVHAPVDIIKLGKTGYRMADEGIDVQAVIYHRLMKRACNWGWRPTEGRQKLPCLKGYLLCSLMLRKLREFPSGLVLKEQVIMLDPRELVGISETLKVFIDGRVNYLNYCMEQLTKRGEDLSAMHEDFKRADWWKKQALENVQALYNIYKEGLTDIEEFLIILQKYSQAVFMATESLQAVWSKSPDTEFFVGKMYHFLYGIYPPIFPDMVKRIDSMTEQDINAYFTKAMALV